MLKGTFDYRKIIKSGLSDDRGTIVLPPAPAFAYPLHLMDGNLGHIG